MCAIRNCSESGFVEQAPVPFGPGPLLQMTPCIVWSGFPRVVSGHSWCVWQAWQAWQAWDAWVQKVPISKVLQPESGSGAGGIEGRAAGV